MQRKMAASKEAVKLSEVTERRLRPVYGEWAASLKRNARMSVLLDLCQHSCPQHP